MTLENFIQQKLAEVEITHTYEVATDSVRAWIDTWNDEKNQSANTKRWWTVIIKNNDKEYIDSVFLYIKNCDKFSNISVENDYDLLCFTFFTNLGFYELVQGFFSINNKERVIFKCLES